MRLLRYLAVGLIVALAATGIAIAAKPGPTTKEVAAKFTTTTPHVINTKTCTGTDGTYVFTDAVYSGTAMGTLTEGATDTLRIHAHMLVNQTTGDGTANGEIQIKNGHAPVVNGHWNAVVSSSSSLNGLILGHGPAGPPPPLPPQHLVANFTATVGTGGINGQIGGNASTMTDSAVSQSGPCPPMPKPPHHPAHPNPQNPGQQ